MPEKQKAQFTTEVVSLPSKGKLYSKENPLSSGKIELKYMTAREEDILTSRNLIKKGIVLDRLLEAVIVNSKVNLDDVLLGDKNAIMIATRILGYGKDYTVQISDPSSDEKQEETFDLTKIGDKEIDYSIFKRGINEFEFELPASKRNITFKFLSQRDEREVDNELKALKKISSRSLIDSEVTTRLKKAILSIDGDSDRNSINGFVENEFLSRDSLSFRSHLAEITPDINMNYVFTCEFCDNDEEITVPMTVQFFWPTAGK